MANAQQPCIIRGYGNTLCVRDSVKKVNLGSWCSEFWITNCISRLVIPRFHLDFRRHSMQVSHISWCSFKLKDEGKRNSEPWNECNFNFWLILIKFLITFHRFIFRRWKTPQTLTSKWKENKIENGIFRACLSQIVCLLDSILGTLTCLQFKFNNLQNSNKLK